MNRKYKKRSANITPIRNKINDIQRTPFKYKKEPIIDLGESPIKGIKQTIACRKDSDTEIVNTEINRDISIEERSGRLINLKMNNISPIKKPYKKETYNNQCLNFINNINNESSKKEFNIKNNNNKKYSNNDYSFLNKHDSIDEINFSKHRNSKSNDITIKYFDNSINHQIQNLHKENFIKDKEIVLLRREIKSIKKDLNNQKINQYREKNNLFINNDTEQKN